MTWRYTDAAHSQITNDAGAFVPANLGNATFAALDPAQIQPYAAPPPTAADVDAERDRRIAQCFTFGGVAYQLDRDSQDNISGAGTRAMFAVAGGKQSGDLRWFDPSADFKWIASDNSRVPMDAITMAAFATAASIWKSRCIFIGSDLKAMSPIPADFAADSRWTGGS